RALNAGVVDADLGTGAVAAIRAVRVRQAEVRADAAPTRLEGLRPADGSVREFEHGTSVASHAGGLLRDDLGGQRIRAPRRTRAAMARQLPCGLPCLPIGRAVHDERIDTTRPTQT